MSLAPFYFGLGEIGYIAILFLILFFARLKLLERLPESRKPINIGCLCIFASVVINFWMMNLGILSNTLGGFLSGSLYVALILALLSLIISESVKK